MRVPCLGVHHLNKVACEINQNCCLSVCCVSPGDAAQKGYSPAESLASDFIAIYGAFAAISSNAMWLALPSTRAHQRGCLLSPGSCVGSAAEAAAHFLHQAKFTKLLTSRSHPCRSGQEAPPRSSTREGSPPSQKLLARHLPQLARSLARGIPESEGQQQRNERASSICTVA